MKINPSIVCEDIGSDIVVLDSESQSVLTISGVGASVIKRMLAGEPVGEDEPGVAELAAQGILVTEVAGTVSRRTLMVSGAALGAGGVVALGLPVAANASSPGQLPAPSFDFIEGIVLSLNIIIGGSDPNQEVTSLKFEVTSLLNESDYPSGFVLEWSLNRTTGFDQVFERTTTDFVWEAEESGGDITGGVKMGDNWDDPDLTVFIRARFGTSVSESVEVIFDNYD